MIALHKPQRATYGQAVEAQAEYAEVTCRTHPPLIHCVGVGTFLCCM